MRNAVAAARLEEDAGQSANRHRFRFKSDEAVFAGHFPGEPILPGVFQIEMARQAAEIELARNLAITKIVKAKFSRVIRPEETVEVELTCKDEDGRVSINAVFTVSGETAGKCTLALMHSRD